MRAPCLEFNKTGDGTEALPLLLPDSLQTTSWGLVINMYFSHRLEDRRKAKAAAYYERKKLAQKQLTEAKKGAKVDAKTVKALEAYGH